MAVGIANRDVQADSKAGKPSANSPRNAEWIDTWRDLVTEVAAVECELQEDLQRYDLHSDTEIDLAYEASSTSCPCVWGVEVDLADQASSTPCPWQELAPLRCEVKVCLKTDAEIKAKGRSLRKRLQSLKSRQRQDGTALNELCTELEKELQPSMSRFEGWLTAPAFVSSLSPSQSTETRQRWRGPVGSDGGAYMSGRLWATHALPGSPQPFQTGARGVEPLPGAEDDVILEELREEVLQLDEEIRQAGGSTGGWSATDHQVFARLFRMFRHHSLPVLCDCLAERLPTTPREDIEAHAGWFSEYERKQALKRKLLAKWRDRKRQLDCQALEAHEQDLEEQRRRREGLQRSRSELLRQQVEDWQRSQSKLKKQSTAERLRLERRKSELEKRRKCKEERQREVQKMALDSFQRQRLQARQEEERLAMEQSRVVPPSPEVLQRISHRNDEMLRKRREAKSMQRSQSQPAKKSARSRAYDGVENNPYASTECYRQHVEARLWGEPAHELDNEVGCIACLWEASMQKTHVQPSNVDVA